MENSLSGPSSKPGRSGSSFRRRREERKGVTYKTFRGTDRLKRGKDGQLKGVPARIKKTRPESIRTAYGVNSKLRPKTLADVAKLPATQENNDNLDKSAAQFTSADANINEANSEKGLETHTVEHQYLYCEAKKLKKIWMISLAGGLISSLLTNFGGAISIEGLSLFVFVALAASIRYFLIKQRMKSGGFGTNSYDAERLTRFISGLSDSKTLINSRNEKVSIFESCLEVRK